VEQYYVHHKALHFGLEDLAAQVADSSLSTLAPGQMKARCNSLTAAPHHRPAIESWDLRCVSVLSRAVLAKFTQSPGLASALLATGTMPLVESSPPSDRYWGCGIPMQALGGGGGRRPVSITASDIKRWTAGEGSNMAGWAVMQARRVLMEGGGFDVRALALFQPAVEKELGAVKEAHVAEMEDVRERYQLKMDEERERYRCWKEDEKEKRRKLRRKIKRLKEELATTQVAANRRREELDRIKGEEGTGATIGIKKEEGRGEGVWDGQSLRREIARAVATSSSVDLVEKERDGRDRRCAFRSSRSAGGDSEVGWMRWRGLV